MPDSRDRVVCLYCGREGHRGFTILSGDPFQDAGRVTYICTAIKACKRRQITGDRPQWYVLNSDRTNWGTTRFWEGPFYSRKMAREAKKAAGKRAILVKAVKETEEYE